MRIPIALLLLALCATGTAQIPITNARDLPVGTAVTVRGIVLNGSELGGIRYVQDATGGIAAFPGTGSIGGFNPPRGADVTVGGTLKLFNGLLEIDPISTYTLHSTNNALPAAQLITPAQMDAGHESELVRINACTFGNAGGTFSSGTFTFSSGGQTGVGFLRTGHPLVGSNIPTGLIDLVGIVSRFSSATPPVGGYQLLLRDAADLQASTGIGLTGPVVQDDIAPTSFTLAWNTNVAGSSQVRYGTTPSYGAFAQTTGSTTTHQVQLSGLQPASMVFAQAFSVLGGDTAFSPPGLYSTASPDPGSITVYFTRPVDESVATGAPAIALGNAYDDTLRAYIDRAQITLDIAVYNTSNSSIVTAVNDAQARGVQVRWITEGGQNNSALGGLHPAIPVLQRQNSSGSGMHNKFIIADADGGPAAHVLTASSNFTNSGFFNEANNLVIVQDMALARTYRREFEEMWGGSGAQPNVANSRFGSAKTDNTPHWFNVNGTPVQSWFSPSDGTTERIAEALRTADVRVEFALFALTSSTLTNELLDRQAQAGVTVRGIVEEEDMNLWTYDALLNGGVDIRPDGAPFYLHHKYAIVDHGAPAEDPLVITGSHNWSFNAETVNDENTLIIRSASLADQFHQEWNARWTTAVDVEEIAGALNSLVFWPNPGSELIHLNVPEGMIGASITVVDATGRVMQQGSLHSEAHPLDLRTLAPGTYSVLVERHGKVRSGRFVKLP